MYMYISLALELYIDGLIQDCSCSGADELELPQHTYISMAQCKTAVTPVHQHWSYSSLALNY